MTVAYVVLYTLAGYLGIGVLVGLAFVIVGVSRADHAAKGTSIAFRALILPGCAALWPVVLVKWARAGRHP